LSHIVLRVNLMERSKGK